MSPQGIGFLEHSGGLVERRLELTNRVLKLYPSIVGVLLERLFRLRPLTEADVLLSGQTGLELSDVSDLVMAGCCKGFAADARRVPDKEGTGIEDGRGHGPE